MRRFFLLNIVLFFSTILLGQEQLSGLGNNPQIEQPPQQKAVVVGKYKFEIDTVELPFIDDFVVNRQKLYRRRPTDILTPIPFDTIKANGEVFDTLKAKVDTVWNYVVETFPQVQVVDSQPADKISIESWSNAFDPVLDNTNYFYPSYRLIYSNFGVDTVHLNPDTVFIGQADTFFIVNDNFSLWMGQDVFINNTYADTPPTTGVATFDGLDSLGHPYDVFNANAFGIADRLTSKPINLEGKSGVILSFFYQPEGLGEIPNEEDSLVLEFYAPKQDKWFSKWNEGGAENKPFTYKEVAVSDTAFLHKGFKFRFKNYATLSGAFDHWHIDYVYLDENRTSSSSFVINDICVKSMPETFLNGYTSVPYHHYTESMTKATDPFEFQVFFNTSIPPLKANYSVNEEFNSEVFSPALQISNPLPSSGVWSESFSVASEYKFPLQTEPTYYTIKRFIESNDNNPWNDTSYYHQFFDTYFAYDDGTPELAYSVVGANGKVAQQFELAKADSLKAVLMYIPEMLGQSSNNFNITIWLDNNGVPSALPLHTGDFISPIYQPSNEPVKFERYELNEPILLEAGKYYVGFTQSFDEQIFVGFDQNKNNDDKIFYNVGNGWQPTEFEGTLMIRPDFGIASDRYIIDPFTALEEEFEESISVYPNPVNTSLKIDGNFKTVRLFNVLGENVLQTDENLIDVSSFDNGIYILSILDKKGIITTKKITVQH